MPLNIFELIAIKGVPGYIADYEYDLFNSDFNFITLIASLDMNGYPNSWDYFNLSDLSGMGSGYDVPPVSYTHLTLPTSDLV